jgi:hemerythrin-like domain-containing protein
MTVVMRSAFLAGLTSVIALAGPGPDKGRRRSQGGNVQKAIDVLMGEHRLIEQALGSLETFTGDVAAGLDPERSLVADYAAFFRGFADACHHGKEEDILFRRLMERGMPRETGPLAVMYHEHEIGRSHVGTISSIGTGDGALALRETRQLVEHSEAFVPLLRLHILKEDQILYPMAGRLLTAAELDAMDVEFETFEARARKDGSHDRLRELADRLIRRFPPDPGRMAVAAQLTPCGR